MTILEFIFTFDKIIKAYISILEKRERMDYLKLDKSMYYEDIFTAAKHNDRQTFRELFLRLHDRDQQEVFHLLYPEKKRKISEFLSAEEFSEIFEYMEIEDQEDAVEYLPNDYIAQVFNNLGHDDVVDFIVSSDSTDLEGLMASMDPKERQKVEEIMSYAPETAGSIMTKEYISINQNLILDEVTNLLREIGRQAETIYYIYVLDNDNHLSGVLSLRDLILSPETETVENIMYKQVISVRVDQDQEEVAREIQDYDLLAIPVVSHDGRMQGIVTVDDIMDVLEEEATEDFIEFAAIKTNSDDSDTGQSPLTAAKQRAPWIIILLVLSLVTGGLIGFFEETISQVVILTAFIPMIMATAGNVGTQSLAVAVRNLTVEDDEKNRTFGETVLNEFLSGLLIGGIVGLVLFVGIWILFGNLTLASIVAVSLLLTTSVSTVVGAVIPVVIKKFNFDPAVASGPFITTINDTLGLLIFFAIATALLSYL